MNEASRGNPCTLAYDGMGWRPKRLDAGLLVNHVYVLAEGVVRLPNWRYGVMTPVADYADLHSRGRRMASWKDKRRTWLPKSPNNATSDGLGGLQTLKLDSLEHRASAENRRPQQSECRPLL